MDGDESSIDNVLKEEKQKRVNPRRKKEKLIKAKERLLKSAKILERMVVQEVYTDLAFG